MRVNCDIAPQLKGITPRDLISAEGEFVFLTDFSEICGHKIGFLFRIICDLYHLEVGFRSNYFYIKRNDDDLEMPIDATNEAGEKVLCFASWTPSQLRLIMLDKTYGEAIKGAVLSEKNDELARRTEIMKTPIIYPPNSLIIWAREEAIAPIITYNSAEDFYEVVTSAIQSIGDKVSTIGLDSPFWDISYEGRKIISRLPKRETDIHPTIHALLFDIAIAKNLQITPEFDIAGGRLDFLITGVLISGELVNACVEFKHAHSIDLLHGLLTQLPAYMRAKGCEFGIYCVMYFKGEHFLEPNEHKDPVSLGIDLDGNRGRQGLSNIRVIILDFSHRTPPSKL